MRAVRVSKTYIESFDALCAQGELLFGSEVVRQKRATVRATILQFLAHHPHAKRPHPELGLVVYPIAKTPFVVLYDFDDTELRVHFIFHKHASLEDVDPNSVEW